MKLVGLALIWAVTLAAVIYLLTIDREGWAAAVLILGACIETSN